jgi:prepilin-type N-terminal cleavage/methylation domain-containing protein
MISNYRNNQNTRGFTLIELLIVIAIIVILFSIVITMTSQLMRSAKSTAEATSLRQVLQAYMTAATDNNGTFIRGYSNGEGKSIVGPDGEKIHWPASGRYVWRLLPYLDNAMDTLYTNREQDVLSQIEGTECYSYIMSLYPSFGLNSEWLGGDFRTTASPALESKRLYASSLSDVRLPARQLVFASSAAPEGSEDDSNMSGCLSSNLNTLGHGYFEIKSPYDFDWRWHTVDGMHSFDPTQNPADHGNIDARHSGKVLTGQLDGATTFISLQELSDMRRWAPKATHQDWTLSDIFP